MTQNQIFSLVMQEENQRTKVIQKSNNYIIFFFNNIVASNTYENFNHSILGPKTNKSQKILKPSQATYPHQTMSAS